MELLTLAGTAILAVTPYLLEKAGGKLIEKTTEGAFEKRKEIWEKVKSLFVGDELITLNLEKYPENEDIQNEVTKVLSERLKRNPDVAKQLKELVELIPFTQTKTNTLTQSGSNNIANQDVTNSSIKINQK